MGIPEVSSPGHSPVPVLEETGGPVTFAICTTFSPVLPVGSVVINALSVMPSPAGSEFRPEPVGVTNLHN